MIKQFLHTLFLIALFDVFAISLHAQVHPKAITGKVQSILFIGNSFTFAHGSPVMFYRPQSVTDLNNTKIGGVPALFKTFTQEVGLDFAVSLETSPGQNLDFHSKNKATIIAKPWDYVVMQGYSTLDKDKPGNPTAMAVSAKEITTLLKSKNANVDIYLVATWARADQVYLQNGFWHGQTIKKMTTDIRNGYNVIAKKAFVKNVIPVGEAWYSAIKNGLADANPYDGIEDGKINLWTTDNYHGSSYGYYIEALMDFGSVTGFDPECLGKNESAAKELGFLAAQTQALQKIAHDELLMRKGYPPLKKFEVKLE